MTAPPAHAASWESGVGGTGVAGVSTAQAGGGAAAAPPGGSASARTAEAGGQSPALSPAGLPAAAAATEAIMSHVSGRPSLPGGLQACEMEQIRGTGSDGSAHAGSGQRPMSEQSPRPPRSLRATTTSGGRRPRSPRGQARAGARVADGGAGRPCGAEASECRGRRQGPGLWA